MEFRNPQVALLIQAFKNAGVYFEVFEVTDTTNPFAYEGEDLLISRHGDRHGFIFQNIEGGKLLWVSPSDQCNEKYKIRATHKLVDDNDAYKIVMDYILIFCG